ncbi:MAG: CheR family methyltransferase [Candidatus Kariarchaeaceae archaeon]
MSDRDKKSRKVARGATLYSKKRPTTKGDKEKEKPKRKYTSTELTDKTTLPIYHSAPDPGWEDKVIEQLGKSGIEVSSYKKRYLIRRIRVRMGRLKLNSYKNYFEYLSKNTSEIKELQESLSINVTRFFRNRDTYELLKKEIFPQLVIKAKNMKQREIKVWSAGCAVGAEPYSLAMISSDVVPPDIRVNIQATDVKTELLQMARNAIYSEPYLAEMTDVETVQYFSQRNQDEYEVNSRIKRTVSFSRHDLMKDEYPSNLDLITCRNVLIYVDRDAQREIIGKFFQALKPGGILILGRTETLFGDWRSYVDIISTKHRIYQKKSSDLKQLITTKPKKIGLKKPILRSQQHKNRLQELKDFREVFEERRKAWTERIERSKKPPEKSIKVRERRIMPSRLRKEGAPIVKRKPISKKKILDKKPIHRITPSKTTISTKKPDKRTTGALSNYRNRLKKSIVPTRVAQIRSDLKTDSEKLTTLTSTPEETYKKIMEKRKEREFRKKT